MTSHPLTFTAFYNYSDSGAPTDFSALKRPLKHILLLFANPRVHRCMDQLALEMY